MALLFDDAFHLQGTQFVSIGDWTAGRAASMEWHENRGGGETVKIGDYFDIFDLKGGQRTKPLMVR